ncbi:MAG: hypothetical protein U0528_09940 [Anaerolineae bacterium]
MEAKSVGVVPAMNHSSFFCASLSGQLTGRRADFRLSQALWLLKGVSGLFLSTSRMNSFRIDPRQ